MRARHATAQLLVVGTALAAMRAASAGPAQDYALHCMGCHGSRAQGVPGRVPPLAGALARFMQSAAGRNYVLRVPGAANSMLDDAQLADVLNWITIKFPGAARDASVAPFDALEVAASRHTPLASVQAARRAVVNELARSGAAPAAEY
jgi:mono/diheme cytochrome c family protein